MYADKDRVAMLGTDLDRIEHNGISLTADKVNNSSSAKAAIEGAKTLGTIRALAPVVQSVTRDSLNAATTLAK